MKKYILLSLFFALFFQGADAQWCYRQFGVYSIDEMSRSQLDMGLKYLLHKRQNTVMAYSVIIPVCSATSLILLHNAGRAGSDEGSAMAGVLGGTLLVITAAGLFPVAVTDISIQSVRISKIRKALANRELTSGFYISPLPPVAGNKTALPVAGIALRLSF